MPTDVAKAIAKYRRKTLFVKLNKQLRELQEAHGGLTLRIRASEQAKLDFLEAKLRDLLDQQTLYADLRHQYMAYALALDKSQRTMRFMVDWIREHQILRNRFEGRGLDASILDVIDQLVTYRTADA